MSDLPPRVQSLTLENFTAFEKASFDFCPGINVLLGPNGTGKSHIMKIIYMLLKISEALYNEEDIEGYDFEVMLFDDVADFFLSDSISDLVHYSQEEALINLKYENKEFSFGINREQEDIFTGNEDQNPPPPIPTIYLPAQEFLSINEGFIATYTKRELPYDETYYDLSLALNALPLRKEHLAEVQEILNFLQEMITGEPVGENEVVTQENGRFKFSLPEGKLDVHLVAEGYRKIATLYYLLRNGSLTKDSILFWDEPEAHLNPKLIVKVAKVLQMLAEAGMQIFITTHDYLLSQELSLLAEYPAEDRPEIKFFALYKPVPTAGVVVEPGQTLAEIEYNPILEEFAAHYERESALFHQSAIVDETH
jgi:predicted ATPase